MPRLALAPMLVQPLVENAIMHGLEPKIEGGEIVVRARMLDGCCASKSPTTAWAGETTRRAPAAGSACPTCASACAACAARFELIENAGHGVTSRLLLPLETSVTTALLADDEPHLLAYIEEQLAQAWPDLRIIGRAANGIEALRLVDELAPDVVFLDIQMPGLNGMQLAERLCAGGAWRRASCSPPRTNSMRCRPSNSRLRLPAQADPAGAAAAHRGAPAGSAGGARRAAGRSGCRRHAVGRDAAPARHARARARRAQRGAARAAAMDPRRPGPGNAPDRRRRSHLLPEQRQVHQRVHGRRRTPDPHPAAPAARTARPQQFWQIHRGAIVAARHVAGTRTDFRGRLLVRLKGREEQLVVSRNYEELFRQM
jgi:hypothetical protein